MSAEKDVDIEFLGLNGFFGTCRARLYRHGGKNVVVMTEVPDNQGQSVTNACDVIAPIAAELLGVEVQEAVFVEHYPPRGNHEATFDTVRFSGTSKKFKIRGRQVLKIGTPEWDPLGIKGIENLCGCVPV